MEILKTIPDRRAPAAQADRLLMSNDLALFTCFHTATIREAMERIDRNKLRVSSSLTTKTVCSAPSPTATSGARFFTMSRDLPGLSDHAAESTRDDGAGSSRMDELIKRERVTVLPIVTRRTELIDVAVAFEPTSIRSRARR